MASEENKFKISSNDSRAGNELLSQDNDSSVQKVESKELLEEKSEDLFSHSHPVVTKKNKVFNFVKRIKSKHFRLSKSESGSGRSAFFSSLESINTIVEERNWIPKVLYVNKPKNSSDNNFEKASCTSMVSNELKPPIPSEWGTEKTELPESERLKNLNILLHSEPSIPRPEKKKKKTQSKVKDSNSVFAYDTSFDPEKEFLELNARYPPSSSKKVEKSSNLVKKKKEDIKFLVEPNEEILSSSSNESLLSPSLNYSISENKIRTGNLKKKHNFQEKRLVHTSRPFLQLEQEGISKKIFESKPGTSKMKSHHESSSASEFDTEKKCHLSSLKIDKQFSDFSLQGVTLETLGNRIKADKSTKVQILEPIRKSEEKLYSPFSSSSANTFQIKSMKNDLYSEGDNTDKINVSSDQDSIGNEVPLEQSLKEFSKKKEDNEKSEENNINKEEDEYLVFSWSSSDLGISRWSLPSRATSLSNSIGDRFSVNYVVNGVVKRFIDVRQLAPVTYSQRPAGNFQGYNQAVESQEASVSHKT